MTSVIVLTRDGAFWGERSLKDTIKLYFRGKIEIIKADESRIIHAGVSRDGVTFKFPAPLVVRLLEFVGIKVKRSEVPFSTEAVFDRDGNVCQYWHRDDMGHKFKYHCAPDERTLDHIIPRCRGGVSSFENCVCACRKCNTKLKRGRTPQEAGLELIRKPETPRLRKGDWVVMRFNFNPESPAHTAFREIMGGV